MEAKTNPQNLIRQVNPQAEHLRPGFYKQIALDLLAVLAAAGVGYSYDAYLQGGLSVGIFLAALAILAILSVLQTFLSKNLGRRFLVLILGALAFLLFFWGYNIGILVTAAFILVLLPFWGEVSGKRELDNALEIKFFKAARPVLSKLTTALILVFIVLYIPLWSPSSVFVSREAFGGFFDWFSNVVGSFYPEIRLNATFSELTRGLANLQLQRDPEFVRLSAQEQSLVLTQTANQVVANLSKSLDAEIRQGDLVSKTLYDFIIQLFEGWQERFGVLFFAVWGIAVFLVLRSFGSLFYWLVGIITFIVYQIMLASGSIRIAGETRTHEVVEW